MERPLGLGVLAGRMDGAGRHDTLQLQQRRGWGRYGAGRARLRGWGCWMWTSALGGEAGGVRGCCWLAVPPPELGPPQQAAGGK